MQLISHFNIGQRRGRIQHRVSRTTMSRHDQPITSNFIDYKVPHNAIVKWYDPKKGFGFVRIKDYSKDIFIHARIIKKAGMEEIEEGDRLIVLIGPGNREGQKIVTSIVSTDNKSIQ